MYVERIPMGRIVAAACVAILTCAAPQPAAAQGHTELVRTYDGSPLTLADAVETSLAQNLDIAALRRQLDVLRLRPGQERSLPPPMFETQVWQWPLNTLSPSKTNFYMPMATQEFPARGKRNARAVLAEQDVALGNTDVAMREREVVNLVKQTYVDLFVSRQAIDVHLAGADILRQEADVSQAKYAAGRLAQPDVLKAIVELSKLHDDLIMLDERAQLASARLNTLLQRPIDTPIGALEAPHERVLTESVEQLQAAALAGKPELVAARQQVERAEAELAVAKQEYKPDYSIQGGYMLMPNQTDALMARVGITWPRAPWSRGKLDLHVAEVNAEIETARARQRALESDVRLSIHQAYVRVKAAEQRASLLRTTILPQSRQALDVSRVGYQSDQGDLLAILDNQRMLIGSELEYDKALGEFQQAVADLERATGTDITPAMLTVMAGAEEAK
jgi:cobalt-zinc-cadmium efflux system outer membrane protein